MFENLNFTKERPLIDLHNNDLSKLFDTCFDENNLDLEMGTLIYNELSLRKSSSSKKILKDLLSKFSSVNHEPIRWLKDARLIVKNLQITNAHSKNSHSIYVILRNGYSKQNQTYGVYVGETSKTPEERFSQHKKGIKSARGVQKYGIQLLRSLWPYGKINSQQKLCYETKLHLSLKKVIPKVSGNFDSKLWGAC